MSYFGHCCFWVSGDTMSCGDHPGCAVTPEECRWPDCPRAREVHLDIVTGRETARWPHRH